MFSSTANVCLAELVDDLLGCFFTDAFEAPGRQVSDDALAVLGQDEFKAADLYLPAEARMFGFLTLNLQEITFAQARRDCRQ